MLDHAHQEILGEVESIFEIAEKDPVVMFTSWGPMAAMSRSFFESLVSNAEADADNIQKIATPTSSNRSMIILPERTYTPLMDKAETMVAPPALDNRGYELWAS